MVDDEETLEASGPVASPVSPEVLWYMESRGIDTDSLGEPLWRVPEPRDVEGVAFDPSRVDRVIQALHGMVHSSGEWFGRPIEPQPWQVAHIIAPIFGWVMRDDDGVQVRWYRDAHIDIPRKAGKTTLSAALMLYLAFADGERGSQVLLAASSKDQASLCYNPIKAAVDASPAFADAGIRAWRSKIERKSDGSVIKAVASVGETLQGTSPNGFVCDELHTYTNLDTIHALEMGTGARRQPLGITITTADAGGTLTPYAVRRERAERDCRSDPCRRWAVVFAAPDGADLYAEETWRRANPGLGVTPTLTSMRAAAEQAKTGPEELSEFLRYRLNVRTKQTVRFIDMDRWDACPKPVAKTIDDLEGRPVIGGFDLSAVSDLTAVCWLTPRTASDPKGTPMWSAVWQVFTPEDNLKALDRRTLGAASRWVDAGLLELTPGNVIDYDVVRQRIEYVDQIARVESISYDPWAATEITSRLLDHGVPMVKCPQSYANLSPALKRVKRLVYSGDLGHDNPIATWNMDNLAVKTDPSGNVRPDKANSGEKIDLIAAMTIAMHEASVYELDEESNGGLDSFLV